MSDGGCSLREVVDLYGSSGFDVISITDHVLDSRTTEARRSRGVAVDALTKDEFQEYLDMLSEEAVRAWEEYEMLLIPGVEVTNDTGKYHIVAVDVKEYIDPDLSVEGIVARIHRQGGIAIAAHPYHKDTEGVQPFIHLWMNRDKYAILFDAWEVANRFDLFNAIGLGEFNHIANSDFHEPAHLFSWKSLVNTEKNVEAVKVAIRKNEDIAISLFRRRAVSRLPDREVTMIRSGIRQEPPKLAATLGD
jgi:predicted metal-dependent phosphoesterase TrpH